MCHCDARELTPHVPFLPIPNGSSFPECRNSCLRVLYIDDALVAQVLNLDKLCVDLLPTLGPTGKTASCGLGIPGPWTSLEHRLKDIQNQAEDIGMLLNGKKTHLIVFNPYASRQAFLFVSLESGKPLQCLDQIRLLGLVIDHELSWWPLVLDIEERCRKKTWSLLKLREAGATKKNLTDVYIARIRSSIEASVQVYGPLLNGIQCTRLEEIQKQCLRIILGTKSRSYVANLTSLGLESLELRRN